MSDIMRDFADRESALGCQGQLRITHLKQLHMTHKGRRSISISTRLSGVSYSIYIVYTVKKQGEDFM